MVSGCQMNAATKANRPNDAHTDSVVGTPNADTDEGNTFRTTKETKYLRRLWKSICTLVCME